jgi:N-methylhydantoinase B
VQIAAQRVAEICGKYGTGAVLQAMDDTLDYGERLALQALKRFPPGTYYAEDYLDQDSHGAGPFEIRVKVTVEPSVLWADFSGSSGPAKGPLNCTRPTLESAVRIIFKALTTPYTPANGGCFRPLEVICPAGTIFTAVRPTPVCMYYEVGSAAADLVWHALAPIMPDYSSAGHFLSPCATFIVMRHPETGEMLFHNDIQPGGWGAAYGMDGPSGLVCISDGTCRPISTEVNETRFPMLIEQYALGSEDGGRGRWRGGRGVVRDYRMLSDNALVTVVCGRYAYAPWGVKEGETGTANYAEIRRADGRPPTRHRILTSHVLNRGDVLRMCTGCGGGWGKVAGSDSGK